MTHTVSSFQFICDPLGGPREEAQRLRPHVAAEPCFGFMYQARLGEDVGFEGFLRRSDEAPLRDAGSLNLGSLSWSLIDLAEISYVGPWCQGPRKDLSLGDRSATDFRDPAAPANFPHEAGVGSGGERSPVSHPACKPDTCKRLVRQKRTRSCFRISTSKKSRGPLIRHLLWRAPCMAGSLALECLNPAYRSQDVNKA